MTRAAADVGLGFGRTRVAPLLALAFCAEPQAFSRPRAFFAVSA